MSQTVALVLPLPVALALVLVLLVLMALSAVALSLRKPGPVRFPGGDEQQQAEAADRGEGSFRLGHLHIDGLADPSPSQRRLR